jgi:transposase
LINKKIDFVGPLASKEKEFLLGFPDEQFQMLAYTTAKGRGGYSGIDTGYRFEQDGGFYKCRAVVVKSDELAEQEGKTLDRNLAKVAADLEKISGHLNKFKYRNYDYANEQIRKTLAKHGSCGKLFHVVLDARDEEAMTLTWEYEPELLDQEHRLLGKYVLATSLDEKTHDADEVLELYKSRHLVEHRFRTTKSTLKIRPVFLQKDERIRALVLVMVTALIVYALIEYVVKRERLATSAKQALLMFRMPAIVTLRVNGQIMQQIGNIKPFMLEILAALNVKPLELRGGVDTG